MKKYQVISCGAKNQVFIAERILRSINSVFVGTENSENSAHDFSVDIETFGVYLDAQLNGNAELGVAKVDSPEVRESLEGIKLSTISFKICRDISS